MTTSASPATTPSSASLALRIGDWCVNAMANELTREGETLRIEPKAMEVLVFLANRAGDVVSRDELLSALWLGAVVGDDALSQAVIKLRKALRDPAKSPQYIETIPRRGYRLVATVKRLEAERTPPEPGPPGEADSSTPARGPSRWPRRATAVAVALVLLIAGGIAFFATRHQQEMPIAEVPSVDDLIVDRSAVLPTVAVMPFETQANDPEQAYLARGIAADLTTDLSGISGLRVMNLSTLAAPERRSTARYHVSGSLHRAPDGLKINVNLFDSQSGQLLWAERFERPLRDLVTVEEQIVRRLVSVLPVKISEAEKQQLARRYTRNPAAYDYFLRGKSAYLARLQVENETAKEMYRKAIELDPTFARAYAGLALTYTADYRNQWTTDNTGAMEKAFELAHTALQIDPHIPEVYGVLGYIHSVRREHPQAIKYLHQAIARDRSYADAYAHLGAVYTHIGQPERTVPLLRIAMRLNADAGFLYFLVLGRAYFFLNNTEQASINLREALARNPTDLETRIFMAANFVAAGNLEGARWEAEEIHHLQPDFATDVWLQTSPMTDAGMKMRLINALAQLRL